MLEDVIVTSLLEYVIVTSMLEYVIVTSLLEYVIVTLLVLCQPNFRFKRWVGHLQLIRCTLKLL